MNLIKIFIASAITAASFNASATAITKQTIDGTYDIKAIDVYIHARVELDNGNARLVTTEGGEQITCDGSYSFNAKTKKLKTLFPTCGNVAVSHTIELKGQTVESLQAKATVLVSLEVDGELAAGSIPFTIEKLN